AHDLGGAVALDELGTGVPAADVPLPIEQKNRVVPDASYQLTELVLGAAWLRFRILLRGQGGPVFRADRLLPGEWFLEQSSQKVQHGPILPRPATRGEE